MKVFLTGAPGFIGSFLVPELIDAGHHMVGLSLSDAGAKALTRAGAEVFRGDVNAPDRLRVARRGSRRRRPRGLQSRAAHGHMGPLEEGKSDESCDG
jgi:nucleoside-diphosphate-sugar epimerase